MADNFLAFWLTIVDRYRAEIERGLGATILPVMMASLDDYLGPRDGRRPPGTTTPMGHPLSHPQEIMT